MRSTDGGRNWTRLRRLAEVGLNDVDCLTDTDCIAAGQKGTNRSSKILLYTTDGGLHWTQSQTPTGAGVFPVGGLACPVNGECFAIAASTMYSGAWVLRSNDLGKTWKITTSVSDDLTSVSCLTATACVAIGYPPPTGTNGLSFPARGYFTTDGWQSAHRSQFKVPSTNLTRVSCAGTSFCLTVALNQPSKSLLITRDGGRTWISAGFPNPAKAGLFSVDCFDATHCVVDGSRKANAGWEGIAMTNDAAKTWTYPHVGGPARNELGRIACWSTHACVALASFGGTEVLRLVQSSVSG